MAAQFHPEYKTRPLKPAPVFLGFILASAGLLDEYLKEKAATLKPPVLGRYDSFYQMKGEPLEDTLEALSIKEETKSR